ncbi:MAG TPA: hypothetical protein VHO91_11070 [Rhodopila sp.]|nr:hypothetical protein [Rhodopila sp.]
MPEPELLESTLRLRPPTECRNQPASAPNKQWRPAFCITRPIEVVLPGLKLTITNIFGDIWIRRQLPLLIHLDLVRPPTFKVAMVDEMFLCRADIALPDAVGNVRVGPSQHKNLNK